MEMFSRLAGVVPRLEFHHARLTDQQVITMIMIIILIITQEVPFHQFQLSIHSEGDSIAGKGGVHEGGAGHQAEAAGH